MVDVESVFDRFLGVVCAFAFEQSLQGFFVGDVEVDDDVEGDELVECFCLGEVSWESVEEVLCAEVFFDELDDGFVRDEFSAFLVVFDLFAETGFLLYFFAE